MKLSDEVINDIRDSANIVDIIGHYIPLIKKGKGYTAVCPFHDDHDPSLSISEDKQIYKCFVCGSGGNVFSFVMNYKKCSFIEAVIEVAKLIGKPLDIEYQSKPKIESKYQKYYDILNETVNFTNYILSTYAGEVALSYLNDRGLEKDIIDYFNIGYNPSKNVLYEFLKSKNFKDEDLDKVNVCRFSDYGMSDVFYDRITFPIHDINGNPIAFSARSMDKNNPAKYVNTSSTILYTKGDVVYNYHRAKEDIKKAKRAIVCEGVMDVIAFKRVGISNVVSTLGTACTVKQLELIKSLTSHIVFCYDGDNAGQSATMKAIELALDNKIEANVIKNETLKDPDEILKTGKAKDLQNFAGNEITGIEFAFEYYKKLYPLNNYSNRKAYHLKLNDLINKLSNRYDIENYLHDLQNLTGLSKITSNNPKIEYNTRSPILRNENKYLDGLSKAEYTIISQMMMSKKAVEKYRRELGCLLDEYNDQIAAMIIEEYRQNDECSYSKLYDDTNDDNLKKVLLEIGTFETLSLKYDEDVLEGAIKRVQFEIQKTKLNDLKEKIEKCEYSNEDELNSYLKEYTSLTRVLGGKYGKDN